MAAYRTRLDEDGCIDLLSILQVVKQIEEEQAWAICHEICTLMKGLASREDLNQCCAPIESLSQLHIHKDGHVHEKTLLASNSGSWLQHQQQRQRRESGARYSNHHHKQHSFQTENRAQDHDQDDEDGRSMHEESDSNSNQSGDPSPTRTPSSPSLTPNQSQSQSPSPSPVLSNADDLTRSCSSPELSEILKRRPALNESELVASLGLALFWALDYEIPNDEERKLSMTMEYLIFQSQSKLGFEDVLDLCVKRLPPATKARAASHYQGVCKSLVQDTIQLSIFLEKIYTASMVLSDISEQELSELGEPLASLRALRIDDWARLWMHVIKELKQALAIT